jgi:hypothetical protein
MTHSRLLFHDADILGILRRKRPNSPAFDVLSNHGAGDGREAMDAALMPRHSTVPLPMGPLGRARDAQSEKRDRLFSHLSWPSWSQSDAL